MNISKKNWKLLSRKVVYDGYPFIKVSIDKVQLPDGKIIDDYHRIEVHNAVMLLVENSEKKLLVYKEYRHGVSEVSLTFPAGGIEKNESIYDASERELIEETGYHGKQWKLIGKYFPTPAYNTCIIHSYLTHCYKQTETNYDEDEVLETKIFSVSEIKKMLRNNKFSDIKTYISLERFIKYY